MNNNMSTNKQDYKKLSDQDLVALLRQNKKQLLSLRIKKVLGDLKNTSVFSNLKKDVARIKTIISQRKKLDLGN